MEKSGGRRTSGDQVGCTDSAKSQNKGRLVITQTKFSGVDGTTHQMHHSLHHNLT